MASEARVAASLSFGATARCNLLKSQKMLTAVLIAGAGFYEGLPADLISLLRRMQELAAAVLPA